MNEVKKEKPKYNVWQNTIYAFKNIWQNGQKSHVVAAAIKIPVSFILAFIALYTPKIILDRLEFSENIQQIIAVIIAILAGTMVFDLINNFIDAKNSFTLAYKMWAYYSRRRYQKYLDADYELLENPEFQNKNSRVGQICESDNCPVMKLPAHFTSLIINILSFILFAGVISTLNPIILLLLSATVFINYFMLKSARTYEHKIQDKRIAVFRKICEFVLYFAAIGQFAGWFSGLINTWLNIYTASLQYCDMREFFDYPNRNNHGKGIDIPENLNGLSIELKNVNYKYPLSENSAIKSVNLRIKAGEKIALVGLNGAGKTTLVKLICGMYSPSEGEILLNGHKVSEYNIDDYYTLFSAVFQNFRFLPVSIAQNISIVPKEQADVKKLERCIQLAGLKEKIDKLDKGIDTPSIKKINSNGTELSGGEQQKLMLARAIYKDAPVLILDEPTAALDPVAESEMYMKYNDIAKNKTSVFISHRLASTRFCDRIVLISDGEIAEIGTHDELIKKGGKYAELFEIQSHYYKDINEMEEDA